jgi:hypothetical protein
MLAVALALGMLMNTCPMKIGIARDGAVFSIRMQGWYRTSQKTLAGVLRGGCYNDANPSEVTSVNLVIAPNAPKEQVDQIFSILEKAGWPKSKVKVETWTNDPQEPR